ncbi:hypothetical protein WT58_24005 [Burkholderia territorii]|nr:hypothetical protein WT58_24005 [Burkholderia territorii]
MTENEQALNSLKMILLREWKAKLESLSQSASNADTEKVSLKDFSILSEKMDELHQLLQEWLLLDGCSIAVSSIYRQLKASSEKS